MSIRTFALRTTNLKVSVDTVNNKTMLTASTRPGNWDDATEETVNNLIEELEQNEEWVEEGV